MVSITTNQFASGSIDGAPVGLAGPDFGLISNSETGSIGVAGLYLARKRAASI
jgi:hypothetical protein